MHDTYMYGDFFFTYAFRNPCPISIKYVWVQEMLFSLASLGLLRERDREREMKRERECVCLYLCVIYIVFAKNYRKIRKRICGLIERATQQTQDPGQCL